MAAVAREHGALWNSLLLAESFLPVEEARARLVEATRRPAAEDRAEAWPLLIRNAARSGDHAAVTSVLEEMVRLRNEQDPVRSAALDALSRVRPALFTEDAEPHLDRITADAVEARDSSPATRHNLSDLALSVLREHAAGGRRELVNWALRTLVRISGNTGGADLGRLDTTLRRGQEHQVYEVLRPWIEAGAEKADYSLAFTLALRVGRRAAGMSELQELLCRPSGTAMTATCATRSNCGSSRPRPATSGWLASSRSNRPRARCGRSWDRHPAPHRPARPAARRDPSVRPLSDQVLPGPCRWTATYGAGCHANSARWHDSWRTRPRTSRCRSSSGPPPSRSTPSSRAAAPISYAAGPGPQRRLLAEAALAALARTDRPADALPELLAHADGERARVAVYAATQASRYAAPSLLAAQLRTVLFAPRAKVTSRKEAARLAAVRLPMPRAAALLTEAYEAPGTHVDVRAAIVAFAGGLLAEEPVWGLLRDAAGAEPVLRTAILRVTPLDLPEPHRERYAGLVREVSSTDDPETATLAFDALARWAPWSPESPTVLADAVTDLTRRISWRAAADGLVTAAAGSPRGGRGLQQALRALAEVETAAATEESGRADADERRDRPARRRVDHLVVRLAQQADGPVLVRPRPSPPASCSPGTTPSAPQAAAITAFHLDLDGEPGDLERLAALTEGRPALAARTAREFGSDCDGRRRRGSRRPGGGAAGRARRTRRGAARGGRHGRSAPHGLGRPLAGAAESTAPPPGGRRAGRGAGPGDGVRVRRFRPERVSRRRARPSGPCGPRASRRTSRPPRPGHP